MFQDVLRVKYIGELLEFERHFAYGYRRSTTFGAKVIYWLLRRVFFLNDLMQCFMYGVMKSKM